MVTSWVTNGCQWLLPTDNFQVLVSTPQLDASERSDGREPVQFSSLVRSIILALYTDLYVYASTSGANNTGKREAKILLTPPPFPFIRLMYSITIIDNEWKPKKGKKIRAEF